MTHIGYLLWEHIPAECLVRSNLAKEEQFKRTVLQNIYELHKRQISYVRLGLSWAEWARPGGRTLITWYMTEYAKAGFNILPCLAHTPTELAVATGPGNRERSNCPPRDSRLYGDFVHDVLLALGDKFFEGYVELWNKFDLSSDWAFELDSRYVKFTELIACGAQVAHDLKFKVVLGGISDVNATSLTPFQMFVRNGGMKHVDVIGFHHLRGTRNDRTSHAPLDELAQQLRHLSGTTTPIWLTEYGFPSHDPELRHGADRLEEIQVAHFNNALRHLLKLSIGRVYWYTLRDQSNEYYGDMCEDATPKLLGRLLIQRGIRGVADFAGIHNLYELLELAGHA